MSPEYYDYLPVLVQFVLAASLALLIIGASHLFGQRARTNKIKDSAYECGIPMEGQSHPRFSVKFYVTAMLFILFDVEVVFMFPFVMIFRDFISTGIPILLPILFFMFVLVLGLIYELRKGGLKWER